MITFRISGWGNTIGPVCVCAPRLSTLSELNRWTYWLNIHVVASAFLHRNELPTCTGNWGDFIFDIAPPAGPFFKEFDNFCLQSEVREDDMELKASHCHKIWGKHEKRNENKQTYKKSGRYKHAHYSIIYQVSVHVINVRTAKWNQNCWAAHFTFKARILSDCPRPFRVILKQWLGSVQCFTGGKERGINWLQIGFADRKS